MFELMFVAFTKDYSIENTLQVYDTMIECQVELAKYTDVHTLQRTEIFLCKTKRNTEE